MENNETENSVASHGYASYMDEYARNCEKNIRQHPERKEHLIEADPGFILWAIKRIRALEFQVDLNAAKVTAQAKTLDWMREAMRESCRDDRSQVLGGCPLLHKDA